MFVETSLCPGMGCFKGWGLLMRVVCACMWVLRGLGSVDANFVCRFCAQAFGFEEVWGLLMRLLLAGMWISSGLNTPTITLVNTLENTTANTLL